MTIRDPSGLNDAEVTPAGVPLEGEELGAASCASQTFAVLSSLAVTIREPSGLNDADSDATGVPLEGEELGPVSRVPDLRRPVPARGDDPRPVGAERRRRDATGVPLEGEELGTASCASQTFAVLSSLAVTIREPSGLNDAEWTRSVCPLRVRSSARVCASQTFAVLSSTRGDDPRAVGAERRRHDGTGVPLEGEDLGTTSCASQTFAVPSPLAVTIRDPSGLNDADMTQSVCPLRVRTSAPRRRVPDLRRLVLTRR